MTRRDAGKTLAELRADALAAIEFEYDDGEELSAAAVLSVGRDAVAELAYRAGEPEATRGGTTTDTERLDWLTTEEWEHRVTFTRGDAVGEFLALSSSVTDRIRKAIDFARASASPSRPAGTDKE